jgi:LPS-assembly protein
LRNTWLLLLLFLLNLCPPYLSYARMAEVKIDEEGPVDIEADQLIYERDSQLYQANGEVKILRGDLSLRADHAQLSLATKELSAWGNVILREGEDVLECERLEINLNTQLGEIYQARLFLKDQNFHITGREAEKLGENLYRVHDVSFTTCDAKRPPWKFKAKELEVTLKGYGSVKGAVFYVEDVPILYLPWATYPLREERQTGFLFPRGGYSNKYGAEVKTAFYWAMRKDMDATLYLNYLGKRGFQEGLEYRYAFTQDTKGEAQFYFIDDHVYDRNRYALFIEHQQKFPYDFYLKGDINRVSDNQYTRDFDEDLPTGARIDSRTERQLRSVLFGGKNWDQFSFLVDAEVYDNLTTPSNDETLQRLPKIGFYGFPQSIFKSPFFYELSTSYTNFWRETGVEAHRGDLFPIASYPMRLFNVLKLNPYFGFRETLYFSHDDPTGTLKGWESRETLETGFQTSLEFYRVYDATTFSKISNLYKVAKWMHIIEPMVSYRYSPRVNQTQLPVFDDIDRIPYMNEITYGIKQYLLGRPEKETTTSGPYEYAKLYIFQSYSLGDPYLDSEGRKGFFSNIRAELWWNFGPYVSAQGNVEFNPYQGRFDVFNFLLTGKDRRNDAVQVQYRSTKEPPLSRVQEINLDARIKTISPLYIFGSFRYDLLNHWRVASFYGAEYQAQCWSLGLVVEDWGQSPTGTQESEVKVKVYFTLLNLGSLGHKAYQMVF